MTKDDAQIDKEVKFFNVTDDHLRTYLCQVYAQYFILIFHSVIATTGKFPVAHNWCEDKTKA